MSAGKPPRSEMEQARRAFLLMLGAGLMFMLAGIIPIFMDLVRGVEVAGSNAVFVAIGGMFIAIASSTYAAAKKKAEGGDGEKRP